MFLYTVAERSLKEVEAYIAFIKEHGDLSPLSEKAAKPLIREQDTEVREEAIVSVKKHLDLPKDGDTGRFKKKLTVKDVKIVIDVITPPF